MSTSSRRKAVDNDNTDATRHDDATVDFTNVLPTIEVTKTANPTAVPETGGDVLFTFVVKNTSTEEPVTITSLSDSVYGTLDGDADCKVGTVLAAGATCEFAITGGWRATSPGPATSTSSRRKAEDNDNTDATDTDDATVDFTNVLPTIEVTKTANPTVVPETGADVPFTFVVKNTRTEEPVTITSLSDSVYGTLAGDDDCKVGTVLAAGRAASSPSPSGWRATSAARTTSTCSRPGRGQRQHRRDRRRRCHGRLHRRRCRPSTSPRRPTRPTS